MSNKRNNSTMPQKFSRQQRMARSPRTTPLARSNPFLKPKRRAVFDESVRVLTGMFPDATLDWIRGHAWATARAASLRAHSYTDGEGRG